MDRRLQLQEILQQIMRESVPPGTPLSPSDNVYFQPDKNINLMYPCIVYHRDNERQHRANNNQYTVTRRYLITVIDRNPDSTIPGRISSLPMTAYSTHFTTDGLNHDNYVTYF